MMTENKRRSLDQIIYSGYAFNLGQYLSEGWQIFRKNMGSFMGYSWLVILMSLAASLIPIVGTIINSLFLSPALISGLFIAAHLVHRNQYKTFEQFFGGFSFYSPLIIQQLLLLVIYIIAALPAIYWIFSSGLIQFYRDILLNPLEVNDFDPFNLNWGQSWLLPISIISYIYISIIYLWSYPFVVLNNADAWEAMEYSRKIINRKWFSFFGMIIVFILITFGVCMPIPLITASIISAGGSENIALIMVMVIFFFLIIIGIVSVLFPWFYCTVYAAFADITKLNEEEKENNLVDHLVG